MPVVASQNKVELALSIVSSTAVSDAKDLCNLLAVSKGLQAAIVSKGGTGTGTPKFTVGNTNLARTCSFAWWLQKYHMLLKQLSIRKCLFCAQDAHDHDNALLLGLRPPLQLTSLSIRHPRPLKLLQQLDAQKLIALEVMGHLSGIRGVMPALAAELGRFSKLQELHLSSEIRGEPFCLGSNLSQLTGLRRLTLQDCSFESADWQHMPSQLQFLECCYLDDAAASNLYHLVQLKELVLNEPYVTGAALTAAAKCMPQLQVMRIWWPERNSQQLQALQAMSSLQRLELEELCDLTLGDIADIAQASGLTSLKLEFGDVCDPDPVELDLSGLTTLQQLHQLDVGHCHVGSTTVSVATFGHTLTHLTLLRDLTVSIVLHDLALAQVLSCTQLTALKLNCREYTTNDDGVPDSDPNNAMYHVLGCFQLNTIALHMTRLQLLRIWACPQDKLVAVLHGPWLPHLKQLELYKHQKHAPLGPEEVKALLTAICQARPALQAGFTKQLH